MIRRSRNARAVPEYAALKGVSNAPKIQTMNIQLITIKQRSRQSGLDMSDNFGLTEPESVHSLACSIGHAHLELVLGREARRRLFYE